DVGAHAGLVEHRVGRHVGGHAGVHLAHRVQVVQPVVRMRFGLAPFGRVGPAAEFADRRGGVVQRLEGPDNVYPVVFGAAVVRDHLVISRGDVGRVAAQVERTAGD